MTNAPGLGTARAKRLLILLAALIAGLAWDLVAMAQPRPDSGAVPPERWHLAPDTRSLTWEVAHDPSLPHQDRVELGGRRTAAILTYAVDAQRHLELTRTLVWPSLRKAPNDTHSFLKIDFSHQQAPRAYAPLSAEGLSCFEPQILIDGQPVRGQVRQVRFETGLLKITSDLGRGLLLEQTLTPGVERAGYFELWQLRAEAAAACRVEITPLAYASKLPYRYVEKGVYHFGQPRPEPLTREGDYRIGIDCAGASGQVAAGASGPICSAGVFYSARREAEALPQPDFAQEIARRAAFAQQLFGQLRFECPDPVLETLFAYSKLRGADSICDTQGGPMHAPGGGTFYAAIWANDTVEYVAPFYPFLGYEYANQATRNALDHFARYLNPDYQPLPSSIIAEGTDIWARRLTPAGLPDRFGDRGDAAMLAYGGARFLLAQGDKTAAVAHWPLIEWALEYCQRQQTPEGVIASATDELEGRFPSGTCNLNTTMLTYGGLRSAADLAEELGKTELAHRYRQRAQALHQAARKYFEAEVSGFPTYRYYEGCNELRAWICIPLTMGILDRKEGTLAALFSPRLWTANGILTAEGSTTFWDRSTLYALRGAFNAGQADTALGYLQKLSRCRLLGEHVPYVVEAFPEGNGRQLSAESALYCRVVTEGLFGITPTGFRKFTLQPSLPTNWNHMALRQVKAFQSTFDLEITRQSGSRLKIVVTPQHAKPLEATIQSGESVSLTLPSPGTTAGGAETADAAVMGPGTPLAGLPGYSGGTLRAVKPCGGEYYQAIIDRTNQKQFDHYCAALQSHGFTLYAEHAITNNSFRTYRKGALMAHVYGVGGAGQVRIVAAQNAPLPALCAPAHTKVTAPSFTFFGLEKGGSEGGLGCLFQFEDGSFFIVDGGHKTAAEATDLYEKLRELAPDKNRLVVRAWLFTHAHGDHYGAFLKFAETYGRLSSLRIESFLFNFCNTPEQTQYLKDRGRSMATVMRTIAETYPDATLYKPLTGQTFHYAGAELEVLYCMSDFLPQLIGTELPDADQADADGNIQTVVCRMKLAGQTLLITGDAAKVCVDEMCARYGPWLKSDMMTVPHHGWNQNRYRARNGTVQFYTLVDPTVVFWPDGVKAQAQKLAWNGEAGGNWEANWYLLNRLHVRRCLVAGSTTQTLSLPYRPADGGRP